MARARAARESATRERPAAVATTSEVAASSRGAEVSRTRALDVTPVDSAANDSLVPEEPPLPWLGISAAVAATGLFLLLVVAARGERRRVQLPRELS